ncbi:PRO41 protein [Purpureocillium lavendulum]|uniref:PRO41 protein n=1 Tax=Purpureocillium lavendulum TaxID=1247861 RepID=A0AB34FER8_9HYPO|nr:PRO41 protein [Purpureocillium lavendulum]
MAETIDIPDQQVPVDAGDADSAIDEGSILSSTATLRESIFDYRLINGRTFQRSETTEYWCPNDDKQQNGLDIAHHFITILKNDKLFTAPIDSPSRVLDLGTGTGIWAIDMADEFPSAEVIGTDISPIQPPMVPPNCIFHIDDAQLEWTYRPGSFDFVHIRGLYGSIRSWEELYCQTYSALRPGGWIENTEISIHVQSDAQEVRDNPDHIFWRWANVLWEGADRIKKTLRIADDGKMPMLARGAGFVTVKESRYKVPIGSWSRDPKMKEIGAYNLAFLDESLEGFALFILMEIMRWESDAVQLFIMEMRNAIRNRRICPYYLMEQDWDRILRTQDDVNKTLQRLVLSHLRPAEKAALSWKDLFGECAKHFELLAQDKTNENPIELFRLAVIGLSEVAIKEGLPRDETYEYLRLCLRRYCRSGQQLGDESLRKTVKSAAISVILTDIIISSPLQKAKGLYSYGLPRASQEYFNAAIMEKAAEIDRWASKHGRTLQNLSSLRAEAFRSEEGTATWPTLGGALVLPLTNEAVDIKLLDRSTRTARRKVWHPNDIMYLEHEGLAAISGSFHYIYAFINPSI